MDPDEKKIETWKTTIEVQQHFNDLQLRLRSFLLTVVGAILTAAAYALKEHVVVHFGCFSTSLSAAVCVLGLIVTFGFYYMDWGYHQLLSGAVAHGQQIEESVKSSLPELGLTAAIKKSSTARKFLGVFPTKSLSRLNWFYGVLFFAIGGLALAAHLASVSATAGTDAATKSNVSAAPPMPTPNPTATVMLSPTPTPSPVATATAAPSATPTLTPIPTKRQFPRRR
jgi:hypothetical protein